MTERTIKSKSAVFPASALLEPYENRWIFTRVPSRPALFIGLRPIQPAFFLEEYWLTSHLQLGKIYEQKGDLEQARQWYGKLLNLWKDGDPDIVALIEAKARLSKMMK